MSDKVTSVTEAEDTLGLPILFNSSRRAHLLGVLASAYKEPLTPTRIFEEHDFNYSSLYNHLNSLQDLGLIETSGSTKPRYYKLHPKSGTTVALVKLHEEIHKSLTESPDTFEPLLSTKARSKLLAGILYLDDDTFTQPTTTDRTGLSTKSFYSAVSKFEELSIVEEIGKDGKAVLYEIQNPKVWDLLDELEQTICLELLDEDCRDS